ncbi:MAG: sugar phosphate nucleotidyltransferase [Bacteroidota bacterium]
MIKLSLVVLAAGMGSRYGGLKQLDGVGPNGQTIMDYSVHDAIQAGFDQIIFVIRRDFEAEFKEKILSKYNSKIECVTVFQEMNSCTQGIGQEIIDNREKPWGTAHATLVSKEVVNGPFAVINADDFYGKDAFVQIKKFLAQDCKEDEFGMVAYELDKTLSENGTVNRGICSIDKGYLSGIVEGLKISKSNGAYKHETPNTELNLNSKTLVSMNFFGFHPSVNTYMQKEFVDFANENSSNPKSEYFIPLVLDNMMKKGLAKVRVIPTSEEWIGVTYQEDKPEVMERLNALTERGVYEEQF